MEDCGAFLHNLSHAECNHIKEEKRINSMCKHCAPYGTFYLTLMSAHIPFLIYIEVRKLLSYLPWLDR